MVVSRWIVAFCAVSQQGRLKVSVCQIRMLKNVMVMEISGSTRVLIVM